MSSNGLVLCLALAGTFASMACRRGPDPIPVVEPALAPPVASVEPTEERLLQRANERWARIAVKDWVAAYEYLTSEQRATLPLDTFLKGKQYLEYSRPRVAGTVWIDGERAFLRVLVDWMPPRGCTLGVRIEPKPRSSLEVEIIETWRWNDGEWFFVRAQHPDEFLAEHRGPQRSR